MPAQTIKQGTCTGCDESEENYTIDARAVGENRVEYRADCDCGETAACAIGTEGIIATTDNLSVENASWNESDEEEEDE
jgi:hypothetical protein